jgi:hypothetical protein
MSREKNSSQPFTFFTFAARMFAEREKSVFVDVSSNTDGKSVLNPRAIVVEFCSCQGMNISMIYILE